MQSVLHSCIETDSQSGAGVELEDGEVVADILVLADSDGVVEPLGLVEAVGAAVTEIEGNELTETEELADTDTVALPDAVGDAEIDAVRVGLDDGVIVADAVVDTDTEGVGLTELDELADVDGDVLTEGVADIEVDGETLIDAEELADDDAVMLADGVADTEIDGEELTKTEELAETDAVALVDGVGDAECDEVVVGLKLGLGQHRSPAVEHLKDSAGNGDELPGQDVCVEHVCPATEVQFSGRQHFCLFGQNMSEIGVAPFLHSSTQFSVQVDNAQQCFPCSHLSVGKFSVLPGQEESQKRFGCLLLTQRGVHFSLMIKICFFVNLQRHFRK